MIFIFYNKIRDLELNNSIIAYSYKNRSKHNYLIFTPMYLNYLLF